MKGSAGRVRVQKRDLFFDVHHTFVEGHGYNVLLFNFCLIWTILSNSVLLIWDNTRDILTYQGFVKPSLPHPPPPPKKKWKANTSDLEWSIFFPFYTFYHITLLGLDYRRQCYGSVVILIFSRSRVMKTITLNASANICPYLLLKEIVTIEPVMNYISI